jgi:RHS repeat-associated protein
MANHFDPVQGRDWLKVQVGGQDRLTQTYSYDPNSGRLKTASYGNYSSSYAYRANSDLLQTISGKYLETTKSTATYDWDYGVRVKSVQNSGSGLLSSHTYIYDPLGRRRSTALMDGSHWEYGYNDRNELTSGKHYWGDASFAASQQFEYGYDSIGNRDYTRSGGDGAGNNLRFADYTANGLNQYSVRGVPGTVDITGLATEGQTVTVNGQNASRHADYFSAAAVLNTGGAPVSQSVTVQLLGSGGTSTSGRMTMPGSSESFIYDNDGNLSEDSLWTYGWDGENRLIRATRKAITGMPSADRKELTFAYDDQGRRISRTVAAWNGVNAFINPITTKFLYDGWNLIAELDQSNNLIRSYLWGLDLSGSRPDEEQEAGGIGGLLLVTDHAANASHFTGYDGSGNIVVLVNGSTGEASARYQYSPFGQLIQATGPMAKINPFRWSTKYWDEETGLSYYGLRYYSPDLGRWLNPDPIGEQGGPNLYAFVANSPANFVDPQGAMLLDFLIAASEDVDEKTAELATKTSYVERVRSAVKNMENLQMFIAGIQEADDNQFIDLIDEINQLQDLAAEGFRGSKSMAKRSHHLTPQAKELGQFFRAAEITPDNFVKDIPKWQHDALHQIYKGEYDGRGGPWNEIWRRAKSSENSNWKNKYFVAGFAAGIVKRTALDVLPLP